MRATGPSAKGEESQPPFAHSMPCTHVCKTSLGRNPKHVSCHLNERLPFVRAPSSGSGNMETLELP
jgi:hypothetical protein